MGCALQLENEIYRQEMAEFKQEEESISLIGTSRADSNRRISSCNELTLIKQGKTEEFRELSRSFTPTVLDTLKQSLLLSEQRLTSLVDSFCSNK